MLTIKEMSEKFNIPKSTLYGWEKERKEVFNYLKNIDSGSEELRILKMMLDKYSKTIDNYFELKEIEFILSLKLKLDNVEDIENLHTIYSYGIINHIKELSTFVLGIYIKLEKLNLIEKYIFVDCYKNTKKKLEKNKNDKISILKHYFKPFFNG